MSEKIQEVIASYSDYTNVRYVPVTREELLDRLAKSMQTLADRLPSKEQK